MKFKKIFKGWGHGSSLQCLPGKYGALGSIHSITKKIEAQQDGAHL
jgi:hypothetical protein